MENLNRLMLDKKLLKTYASEEKLAEKIALLLKQQDEEKAKRIELEKTHLYKEYEVYDISLEAYTKIVRKALTNYTGLNDEKKADIQRSVDKDKKLETTSSAQNVAKTNNLNLDKKGNGEHHEKKAM